ncbi:hypothetical protein ACVWXO_007171 [Bradyrhizobium sp. LM2.7]
MSSLVLQMSCVAGLLGIAVLAIMLSRAKTSTTIIYRATTAVSLVALFGSIRFLVGEARRMPPAWSCRSGYRGLAPISAWMRWPRFFSLWSIWVGRQQAFMVWAMGTMIQRRIACCLSFLPFWPA